MTALAFIAEDVVMISSPTQPHSMSPQEFQAAIAAGQFVRRADGTYVAASSLGSRSGFNLAVCLTPSPSSNVYRVFGAGVAEMFFRADVAAEAVHLSSNRSN
jgi:hypothetical protein